jgi:hypothetical protein
MHLRMYYLVPHSLALQLSCLHPPSLRISGRNTRTHIALQPQHRSEDRFSEGKREGGRERRREGGREGEKQGERVREKYGIRMKEYDEEEL